ncbi:MAG: glycosyltransferase family 10 domain-containing protein [Promethearchaeota archaeon]
MIKCKMVGGGFQHQNSVSINNRLPDDFIWIKNNTKSDIEIYIDSSIRENIGKSKENKYAWVFESEKIFNIEWILNDIDSICGSYELIFTHNRRLLDFGRNFVFIPGNAFWIKTPEIAKKNKLVSMIYSNKLKTEGHRKRKEIADKYKKNIDLYGRGVNPIKHKEDGLRDYMFSIAVENGKYNDYFTEKILDCFAMGTIPVYWGCDNIDNYFDGNGIIKLSEDLKIEELNEELYYSKIKSIKNNFDKVMKYQILEEWVLKNRANRNNL